MVVGVQLIGPSWSALICPKTFSMYMLPLIFFAYCMRFPIIPHFTLESAFRCLEPLRECGDVRWSIIHHIMIRHGSNDVFLLSARVPNTTCTARPHHARCLHVLVFNGPKDA